jgi:hypothetical protein
LLLAISRSPAAKLRYYSGSFRELTFPGNFNLYGGKDRKENFMSTKIAEYKFTSYDEWTAAKDRLYAVVGSSSYTNWDSSSYSDSWYISIYDECSDVSNAGQICRGHGGKACSP